MYRYPLDTPCLQISVVYTLEIEEKGVTEDEMVGWLHRFNGRESEQTLGGGEGQGSLERCRLQGHKESDTAERLNNSHLRGGMVIDHPVFTFFRGRPCCVPQRQYRLINTCLPTAPKVQLLHILANTCHFQFC